MLGLGLFSISKEQVSFLLSSLLQGRMQIYYTSQIKSYKQYHQSNQLSRDPIHWSSCWNELIDGLFFPTAFSFTFLDLLSPKLIVS